MNHVPPPLPKATELAHQLIRERLTEGDTAIDATVGNGHDTLFLANLVGPKGKVIGFDIQSQAIRSTRERTASLKQVSLIQAGHEAMGDTVDGEAGAVMFNLGYLPSGDKSVTTLPATTLEALESAKEILAPYGMISIALYTGHTGGNAEAEAVEDWCQNLPQDHYAVAKYHFINQRNSPPQLIVVQRRS
ncbi:MAG: class I SAM-dependent methyltransferase [Verrucomicrobiota bacterium]